jgi:putative endonuclease
MHIMRKHEYYTYIVSSLSGVLYVGVTNNLDRRMSEHQSGAGSKFTSKYNCKSLLYFEEFKYVLEAIAREKQIKRWNRAKKISLIREFNPKLKNLLDELYP